jgi:membrane-associated protease RseP (regulator of RpoE activity)
VGVRVRGLPIVHGPATLAQDHSAHLDQMDAIDPLRSGRAAKPPWPPLLAAVPVAAVVALVWTVQHGKPTSSVLPGMTVEIVEADQPRLVVTSVQSNGPAAQGAIRVGDVIEAVDGHKVRSIDQLTHRVVDTQARRVVLKVGRGATTVSGRLDKPMAPMH